MKIVSFMNTSATLVRQDDGVKFGWHLSEIKTWSTGDVMFLGGFVGV